MVVVLFCKCLFRKKYYKKQHKFITNNKKVNHSSRDNFHTILKFIFLICLKLALIITKRSRKFIDSVNIKYN